MLVEMDVNKAVKSAIVQESWGSARLLSCNSARGTGLLHQCKMAQRGVQRCEMQGDVATVQSSVEGALVSGRGSFSINNVSYLIGMLELGGLVTYFSETELQCSS